MLGKMQIDLLNRLVECRKSSGITQTQIAKDLNCTRSNIYAFEQGITSSGRVLMYYIDKFGGDINGKQIAD